MILPFVIIYFIFWIIYYIIQGAKDANVILWQQSTVSKTLTDEQKLASNKYNEAWQEYDKYKKLMVHVFLTLPIFLIGGGVLLFVSLLMLSLSIRLLVYNYFINKCMKIDVNHISMIDWFDWFMVKLENKGTSQWTVKFSLLVLSIILVVVFLLI